MTHTNVNLQDSFLNQVRKDNVEVELRLVDGTCLKGHVRGFDNFTVIMYVADMQHMVYKHAVAHVVAPQSVRTAPPTHETRKRPDKPAPRRENASPATAAAAQAKPEKFNSLDFSTLKIENPQTSTPDDGNPT